jgi:hypothetical protein
MEFLSSDKKDRFDGLYTEIKKYDPITPEINVEQKVKSFFSEQKNQKHMFWIAILLCISAIPGIIITIIDSKLITVALTVSGAAAAALVGNYVGPLIKKITEQN